MLEVSLNSFFPSFIQSLGGSLRYGLAFVFAILVLRVSMRFLARVLFIHGYGSDLDMGDTLFHRRDDGVIEKYERSDPDWRPPRGFHRSELDSDDFSLLGLDDDEE